MHRRVAKIVKSLRHIGRRLLTDVRHLLLPNVCQICGCRLLESDIRICQPCLDTLNATHFEQHPSKSPIVRHMQGRIPIRSAAAIFYFKKTSPIRSLIHSFKYHDDPQLAISLGREMGRRIVAANTMTDYDFLIPVPLHKTKLRLRGYNQSLMLAHGISLATNIPVCDDALIRHVNTNTQTRLKGEERLQNVKNVFSLTPQASEELTGRKVLIIDDVYTTGATTEECANTLLQIPNLSVGILTLAYAKSGE